MEKFEAEIEDTIVDAKQLLPYISAMFTSAEREEIESKKMRHEQNYLFWQILHRKCSEENFDTFLEALKKEKYDELAKTLKLWQKESDKKC